MHTLNASSSEKCARNDESYYVSSNGDFSMSSYSASRKRGRGAESNNSAFSRVFSTLVLARSELKTAPYLRFSGQFLAVICVLIFVTVSLNMPKVHHNYKEVGIETFKNSHAMFRSSKLAKSYYSRYLRKQKIDESYFQEATLASGGFFDDILDDDWRTKMYIHCRESVQKLQEARVITNQNVKTFYMQEDWKNFVAANYEPTFTCPYEEKLGSRVDGGKWICDPYRIIGKSCLVYSIGSNNQFDFEEAMIDQINRTCMIHTFDPRVEGSNKPVLENVHFHRVGISSVTKSSEELGYWHIGNVLKNLGHTNLTIDILKMDCEGCEFEVFTQEFFQMLRDSNIIIRQIAVELHPTLLYSPTFAYGAMIVRNLFEALFENGYVIYHKEINTIANNTGQFVEYGFVLIEGVKNIDCDGIE